MLHLCLLFIFAPWYQACEYVWWSKTGFLSFLNCFTGCTFQQAPDITFLMIRRCLGPSGIRGPQSGGPGPEWTGCWLQGGVLASPIMPWITPSSPRQLLNYYPPFCGAKPECVELDGRGAHWNPLAWGVFTLLLPECWHLHNFTHAHICTKCQLRGLRER